MIERVKSVILTVLILTSLLLSSLLWYRSPNVEEINRNEYIPQQLIGESRQLEELVKPRSVVYHTGDGRHFMAFSGDNVYDAIITSLSEWQFVNIEERRLATADWEELLQQLPGLELRFPVSIPAELLTERIFPSMDHPGGYVTIDRLWIYEEQGTLSALLISNYANRVYESTIAFNDGQDLFAQMSGLGLLRVTPVTGRTVSANPYEPIKMSISYFPEVAMTMPEWTAPLQEIDVEQMKNLLFLDPSLVRTVNEAEEGTVVMQDGSRAARYVEADNMLYYHNYKMSLDAKSIEADLHEAVQFINNHGGWMAEHYLVDIDGAESEENANRYGFRLMKDGLPVYDTGNQNRYGTLLMVESTGGHVLRYDRSLHFTSEDEFVRSSPVAGGLRDLERLTDEFNTADIRDMFPAYRIIKEKENDAVQYVPGWRVQFTDGSETWFEALTDEGEDANGLE